MDIKALLNQLDLKSEIIVIAIIAVAVTLLLIINRRRIAIGLREWRIQRCLNRIGGAQIRNLVCADGLDGFYTIDRLALTRDAILLITYKPYGGNIYCAERISEWTQVIGQKSFKFENPLFELENQLTVLRLLVGHAPLRGYLCFSNNALFPKGRPDSVLNPVIIPKALLTEDCESVKAEVQAAWDLLVMHQKEASLTRHVSVKT